jgi:hypothetical protein
MMRVFYFAVAAAVSNLSNNLSLFYAQPLYINYLVQPHAREAKQPVQHVQFN